MCKQISNRSLGLTYPSCSFFMAVSISLNYMHKSSEASKKKTTICILSKLLINVNLQLSTYKSQALETQPVQCTHLLNKRPKYERCQIFLQTECKHSICVLQCGHNKLSFLKVKHRSDSKYLSLNKFSIFNLHLFFYCQYMLLVILTSLHIAQHSPITRAHSI